MLKEASVNIAKSRMKTLITSDRMQCTPVTYEMIYKELYQTLTTKDTTVEKAAQDFLVIFEFGGKTNCKNLPTACNTEKTRRAGFAQDIYNKYAK